MNTSFIKITAKPSIQQNICEFVTNQILYHGESIGYSRDQINDHSPNIFQQLFTIDGIKQIILNKNSILILKKDHVTWLTLGRKIGSILRKLIQTKLPLLEITPSKKNTHSNLTIEDIQQELDHTINKQIAAHNGYIKTVNLEKNILHITMQGGCQGCSQSSATLNHGVQQIINNKFPQIKKIIDTTLHENGTNPYYN